MDKTKLVIVSGPTASGKTSLAVELALAFNGEIISADSMQVYRLMDIGTAKPTLEERMGVAHHLIDVALPDEEYTAARFKVEAASKIREIADRGRNVIIAGGTGLYIKALTQGLFDGPEADWELRRELLAIAADKGKDALHEMLKKIDPEGAGLIHPNNLNRVIRAIEVFELAGKPISGLQKEHSFSDSPYECLKIGLDVERKALFEAIDRRVDKMVSAGLLEETRALAGMGYGYDLKPMCGLGYKEMSGFLNGEYPLEEAVRLIKRNTRHYAKRQLTWFRKDPDIKWFNPSEIKDIIDAVGRVLQC
jgi:tRNA dimethylallyltransferase